MSGLNSLQEIMGLISACFPRFEKSQAAAYSLLLRDIPVAVLREAVKNVIKVSRFLPTVAEIREEAYRLIQHATKSRPRLAEEEWEVVYRAIGRYGPYTPPEFDNPLTAQAVKKIGWVYGLCGADTKDMPFLRQQFCKTWKALAERERESRRIATSLKNGQGQQIIQSVVKQLADQKSLKPASRKKAGVLEFPDKKQIEGGKA